MCGYITILHCTILYSPPYDNNIDNEVAIQYIHNFLALR